MMQRLAILTRPLTWFYLLAAVLPFERIPSHAVAGFTLRPSLVAAVILVVTVNLQRRPHVSRPPLHALFYGAFITICIVSSLISSDPGHSLRITAYLILAGLLADAIARIVPTISLRTLFLVLLGSSVAVSLFAIYQFVGDLAGLSNEATGLKAMYSSGVFGFPRVQGASLEPLYFANYLLLPLAIIVSVGLVVGVSMAAVGLITIALLLTLSRGGVGVASLMLVTLLVVALLRHRYREAVKLTAAVGVGVAMVYLGLTYLPHLLHHATKTGSAVAVYTDQVTNYDTTADLNLDRSRTRELALDDWKAHSLIGNGPGNFGRYASTVDHRYAPEQIANNEPAELLAETGLLGFITFAAFALLVAVRAIVACQRDERTLHRAIIFAVVLYLGATTIQYWSFSTLYVVQVWFAIGLVLGLTRQERTV